MSEIRSTIASKISSTIGKEPSGGSTPSDTTLTISITDSLDPVITAVNFNYSVVVENTGSIDAVDISATIQLDSSLTFVSGSGTGWTVTPSGQQIMCTRSSLAVGVAPTITITVTTADASSTETTTADVLATNAPPATQDSENTTVNIVNKDSTSGKRFPESLTQWQNWITYQIAIGDSNFIGIGPDHLWLMQESSGNPADSIGSKNFTASTGLNSPSYQKTIPGWSRKAIGGPGTLINSTLTNTSMVNTATTSFLVMALVRFDTPTVTLRNAMTYGNTSVQEPSSTGKLRLRLGGSLQDTAAVHGGSDVHIVWFTYNISDSLVEMFTDLNRVSVTFSSSTGSTLQLTTSTVADSGSTDFLGVAAWDDTEVSSDTIKATSIGMGFAPPWS